MDALCGSDYVRRMGGDEVTRKVLRTLCFAENGWSLCLGPRFWQRALAREEYVRILLRKGAEGQKVECRTWFRNGILRPKMWVCVCGA